MQFQDRWQDAGDRLVPGKSCGQGSVALGEGVGPILAMTIIHAASSFSCSLSYACQLQRNCGKGGCWGGTVGYGALGCNRGLVTDTGVG